MKRTLAFLAALLLAANLAACSQKALGNATSTADPVDSMKLEDVMTSILDGVADLPDSENRALNAENFANYAFLEYKDGYEGLANEAMINVVTHSVVLVRLPEGADAEAAQSAIKKDANPNKWVCVSAEKTEVARRGRTVLLVMSSEKTAKQIAENFEKLGENTSSN